MVLQNIINILYRYPKAKLAFINKFGGYFEHKKMLRNKKAMKLASLQLPPVASYPTGLPVYFLTGEKFLYQTLFCIQSLSRYSTEKFKFILVDDGSLDDPLISRINIQLPGADIITKAIIEQNLDIHLPENKYPLLRKKRGEYAHIKKLTDIHTISIPGWKMVLDSDMLFFNDPVAIVDWLKNPSGPLHMVDCTESYGYSHSLMENLSGNKIPDKINVGAIGLNSATINWDKVEHWVKTMEQNEGRSYYLEQALSAMLLAGEESSVLNANEYIVNPDNEIIAHGKGVLHHYVDLSKKGYFNLAWRKVV